MNEFDAFHLPGLLPQDHDGWGRMEPAPGIVLRWPLLTPGGLRRLVGSLAERRAAALSNTPVARVLDGIDEAARRIADPHDPLRWLADALLPAVCGYSEAMSRLVLERMAADWRRSPLETLLRAELGGADVLDGFRVDPTARRRVRAVGPRLAFHVFSGNVPGVAVTAMIRCLLVKSAVLGKTASDDPVLPVLFSRALAESDPELGGCLDVTYWPGGSAELEAEAAALADLIVVYGGEEALAGLRERSGPDSRIIEHGPRVSLALIARDVLEGSERKRAVADAARAVATFDQMGCVSPHVVYVEEARSGSAAAFAEALAAALEHLRHSLPRGRLNAAEAARIHQVRAAAEFRAAAGADVRIHSGDAAQFTVIYDADPTFEPSCLHRTAWVKPVAALEDVPALLEALRGLVQSVGLAGGSGRVESLARALAEVGVSRIATLADLPWPPAHAHHDGAPPLGELVRWIDIEDDPKGD